MLPVVTRLAPPACPFSGFLARDWGEGSVTDQLHKVGFALHEELAAELGVSSYRRIPVLGISPGQKSGRTRTDLCPSWLDGEFEQARLMDQDGGAQVAPLELCTKLADAAVANGAELRIGTVEGIRTEGSGAARRVRSVMVDGAEIECSAFVVAMGPWACLAQDWFEMPVPMTGIKSTSVVFQSPPGEEVEPFALFCGEDHRFGTHLEVYPRSSGEVRAQWGHGARAERASRAVLASRKGALGKWPREKCCSRLCAPPTRPCRRPSGTGPLGRCTSAALAARST